MTEPSAPDAEPVPDRGLHQRPGQSPDPAFVHGAAPRRPSPRPRRHTVRVKVSRSAQLQQQIKALILDNGLSAGDPLPTEFDLVEELGVGRNSLREALQALQAVGIVEIRHGFGMYVGRMSLGALVDELTFHSRITLQDSGNDVRHLIDIRQTLEIGLVQRVADLYPHADLSAVAAVVEQMDADAARGAVPPETDRLFHEVLYQPLGNPMVAQLLGAFWDVYFRLQDVLGPTDTAAADTVRRHRDIYQAVKNGDRDAAAEAMARHFDGVMARIAALRQSG